jgi:hypothetical protein
LYTKLNEGFQIYIASEDQILLDQASINAPRIALCAPNVELSNESVLDA